MNRKYIIISCIGVFIIPILINYLLMTWGAWKVYGSADSWLGFLANYSGGIIGGIVAYIIANSQIKQELEFNRQQSIEADRSYVSVQEFKGQFRLPNIQTSFKSRIMLTEDYENYIEGKTNAFLQKETTIFYRIYHFGIPEVILNCQVKIQLKGGASETSTVIKSNIGVIQKEEEVFIPLYLEKQKEVMVDLVEVTYSTIAGEKMYYKYDLVNLKEGYWVLNEDGESVEVFSFPMKNSNWIYPNRLKEEQHV
ncbi:hypothetical protein [Priestia sp. P5]|uniref:hypothetical protein n=1 Tax=Priestia sp. P5 TaxID=2917806 RepID=UPI002406800B|nr:hypothetical protein [Priestia sp. P5]MDG0059153.1 hypothetical protein [Priestia sp. P5]